MIRLIMTDLQVWRRYKEAAVAFSNSVYTDQQSLAEWEKLEREVAKRGFHPLPLEHIPNATQTSLKKKRVNERPTFYSQLHRHSQWVNSF